MFKFICLAFVYFMTVSIARADELSCTNLSNHAELYAKYRDLGLNQKQIKKAIKSVLPDDELRRWAIGMLPPIFEAKTLPPNLIGSIVYRKCLRVRGQKAQILI